MSALTDPKIITSNKQLNMRNFFMQLLPGFRYFCFHTHRVTVPQCLIKSLAYFICHIFQHVTLNSATNFVERGLAVGRGIRGG